MNKKQNTLSFKRMIEHLPNEEKALLETYEDLYDPKMIDDFVKILHSEKDLSLFTHQNLSETVRLSLVALSKNKITWQEAVTVHIVISAWNLWDVGLLFLPIHGR